MAAVSNGTSALDDDPPELGEPLAVDELAESDESSDEQAVATSAADSIMASAADRTRRGIRRRSARGTAPPGDMVFLLDSGCAASSDMAISEIIGALA
jgi:hypothetical protein